MGKKRRYECTWCSGIDRRGHRRFLPPSTLHKSREVSGPRECSDESCATFVDAIIVSAILPVTRTTAVLMCPSCIHSAHADFESHRASKITPKDSSSKANHPPDASSNLLFSLFFRCTHTAVPGLYTPCSIVALKPTQLVKTNFCTL